MTDGIRIAFHFYRGTVRRPASRLAKLFRSVPNYTGRVPFYRDTFRTVSAGVANADSALPVTRRSGMDESTFLCFQAGKWFPPFADEREQRQLNQLALDSPDPLVTVVVDGHAQV